MSDSGEAAQFAYLGAALEEAWRACGRDEEAFADIAATQLERMRLHETFDRERWLDTCLDPTRPAIQQLAPLGTFGQPGMTLYHGEGFAVELYYWLNSLPAIHNHPFCGAFTVLDGWSVHACYDVDYKERLTGRAWSVDARLDRLDLVEAGEVVRFSLRDHPLVHALVHVPVPTFSLVVRTVRTEGYVRLLPPSLALPMEAEPEPAARRFALLESLQLAGEPSYMDRLATELERADLPTAVRLLSGGWASRGEDERAALIARVPANDASARDALRAALDQAARTGEASGVREQLADPDLRLVATALAYADCRARVMELLAKRGDPTAMLHRFVAEAGMFSPEEAASAHIADALIEDKDDDGVVGQLAETFGREAVEPMEDQIRDYCSGSIFSVLRR